MRTLRISIAVIITMMICIGIVMIYSSSGIYAQQQLGNQLYFLNRHLIFLGFGLVCSFGVMTLDYRILQTYAKPLILLSFVLLVLVLIPGVGKASFGARRWFKIGGFGFQPAELTKLTLMIYVADFLTRKPKHITHFFHGFFPVMMILGALCLLVVKQPDLGSCLLLGSITFIMLFVAGTRLWHMGGLFLLLVPVLFYLIVKVPYRMRRIVAFLNPWDDPLGAGFQLSQSQIALGSGGVFGVGPGQSLQKLFYLPAAHTDFILSIIGEEFGLVGTVCVIVLFIAFIWQGARLIKRIQNPFGYYLSVGIVSMIALQSVVNIGVSIGAFPTKGLPLPFISYGGSALIFNMVAIALLLNISRTEEL